MWLSAQNFKLSQNNGNACNVEIHTVVLSKFDTICELPGYCIILCIVYRYCAEERRGASPAGDWAAIRVMDTVYAQSRRVAFPACLVLCAVCVGKLYHSVCAPEFGGQTQRVSGWVVRTEKSSWLPSGMGSRGLGRFGTCNVGQEY